MDIRLRRFHQPWGVAISSQDFVHIDLSIFLHFSRSALCMIIPFSNANESHSYVSAVILLRPSQPLSLGPDPGRMTHVPHLTRTRATTGRLLSVFLPLPGDIRAIVCVPGPSTSVPFTGISEVFIIKASWSHFFYCFWKMFNGNELFEA